MRRYLPSPQDELRPFILTDEQVLHVLDWYALDLAGRFVYRRDLIERAKGWGKSPLAGALALFEFAGPAVPDGWDAEGRAVGRPWGDGDLPPPWVQIAAVSEDQTDNTYGALYSMLVANGHRAAAELGIDEGRTRLYLPARGADAVLEPVTASAGSREGQRVTFAVLDETFLWTTRNSGVRLAATLRRNVAKMGGRTLETTNAPLLGEKSVAEKSGTDVERGFEGILHYAIRPGHDPQPDWTDADLRSALDEAYGDSWWIDRDRLVREIRDPATSWDDALRFYFNIRSVGSGRAIDPRRWDALARPHEVQPGTPIGLGFDGSVSRDATVLRGCTADGYSFILGAWERPDGADIDWTVPRSEVHAVIDHAFREYRVGRMFCDPPRWQSEIEEWAEKYGEDAAGDPRVLKLDTNVVRRFAPAVDRWLTGLREGSHTHDGDPLTGEHVRAAHLQKVRLADSDDDGRTKYVLVKGEEKRRIDAAVADVLAYEAAMTMHPVLPTKSVYESRGLTVLGSRGG